MPRFLKVLGIAVAAVTAVGLSPLVSFADDVPATHAPAAAPALNMPPGMLAAMRRDLKLDDKQIATRVRTEAAAPSVEKRLRAVLGKKFAGSWIPAGKSRLTVAVTDASQAATIAAAGADVKVVARNEAELEAARSALDTHAKKADKAVHGWYVDVATNRLVIMAKPGAKATAEKFAATSGVPATAVTVVDSTQSPKPLYDIRGGDQYVINGNTLCSIGFAVTGGFVSAGHCGATGSPTLGYNGVAQGTFAGRDFPGNDYSWIKTNSDWTPQPLVNNYAGGSVSVAGSQEAAIGSSVCRSGRTSGWHCGTILGRNETVQYPQGAVSGLTRSDTCAEPGDSGGAWISGDQAQGVTSGGSGDCTSGGTTWFQPVNEILSVFGLTLTTTGGGAGGGGGRLVSNLNGKCIDVPGFNYADAVSLDVWACNGGGNQAWSFTNGTLRTQNNKCMDVPGGNSANGTPIQIYTCNGGANQQFVLSAAGDLVNPQANKCVDITGFNGGDGAPLELWDCNGGLNQKWHQG